MSIRQVKAVILPPDFQVEVIRGSMPRVEIVDPASLLVDAGYQRELSEKSHRLIRRIVKNWNWSRFKMPVVAQNADGGRELIDGQHTSIAAATHPDVDLIPIMIVDGLEQSDRAAAFVGHNRDRLNLSPLQIHHAAVVSGDEGALDIAKVCARAGVRLVAHMPGSGIFQPRDVVAVSSIRALIDRRGVMRARQVLEIGARAELAPISVQAIRATELLLFDQEFAGNIEADAIVGGLRHPDTAAATQVFAATHKILLWRALAAVIFQKGRSRRVKSAD